jgi:PilZ domain
MYRYSFGALFRVKRISSRYTQSQFIGVQEMDMVKVYVTGNRDVHVICPNCGTENPIDLSKLMSSNIMSIECECHNTFRAFVDRRRYYRKPVELIGMCFASGDPEAGVFVKILDISQTGIGFMKYSGRPLFKNDSIRISVRVDAYTNAITVVASVVNVVSEHIGANITNLDDHTRKLLGLFLLP